MLLTDKYLGENTQIVWLPWDKSDVLGHTDGILHFIDINSEGKARVLVNLYGYEADMAIQMRAILEKHFEVIDLQLNEYPDDSWAYINFLQTSKVIIVPGLGLQTDEEALAQIKALFPEYGDRIYMVNLAKIIKKWGGALNCLTWTRTK